jgi:hypothetical protein
MDNFEFILGMYAIIAGLGVSRLLEGIKDALVSGRAVRGYWVHSAMVLAGLIAHATTWLSLWSLRSVDAWEIGTFLLVLLVPALMYLYSSLALPGGAGAMDLREYYFANASKLHGLLAAALAVTTLDEFVLLSHAPNTTMTALRLVVIGLLVTCALRPHQARLHRIVVPLMLVGGVAALAFLDIKVE